MIAITWAAKNGATVFNSRRCSKDKAVIEDIISCFGESIKVTEFSKELFINTDISVISSLDELNENDIFFFEDIPFSLISEKVDTLIVYRWDRVYPLGKALEIHKNFKLISTEQISGNSHDVIIKEVYKNEEIQ